MRQHIHIYALAAHSSPQYFFDFAIRKGDHAIKTDNEMLISIN